LKASDLATLSRVRRRSCVGRWSLSHVLQRQGLGPLGIARSRRCCRDCQEKSSEVAREQGSKDNKEEGCCAQAGKERARKRLTRVRESDQQRRRSVPQSPAVRGAPEIRTVTGFEAEESPNQILKRLFWFLTAGKSKTARFTRRGLSEMTAIKTSEKLVRLFYLVFSPSFFGLDPHLPLGVCG
jgi:hypothetical protein